MHERLHLTFLSSVYNKFVDYIVKKNATGTTSATVRLSTTLNPKNASFELI